MSIVACQGCQCPQCTQMREFKMNDPFDGILAISKKDKVIDDKLKIHQLENQIKELKSTIKGLQFELKVSMERYLKVTKG